MYALQEVNAKEIYEELNENLSIANVSVILLKKNKIIVKPIDNGKYGKIVSTLNKKGCFYATLNKNNFKLLDISYSFYNKKEEIPVETIKVIKLLEYYNTIE